MSSDPTLDLVLLLNRATLGGFFVLARFRWVFDPSRQDRWFNQVRHASLCTKLGQCGFSDSWALSCCVALAELLGGVGLVAGFLSGPSALAMLVILLAAVVTNSHRKVAAQGPVDRLHCVECFLWTIEPWALLSVGVVLLLGPGQWSLDSLLGINPWEWRP